MIDEKYEKRYRFYIYFLLSIAFVCSILVTGGLGQGKYAIPQFYSILSTITMIFLLVALCGFTVYTKIKRK